MCNMQEETIVIQRIVFIVKLDLNLISVGI